jgi:hypothetical protein
MGVKLSYEEVKQYIEEHDYRIISQEYIKSCIRLKLICPEGHECEIAFSEFKRGKRCKTCANINKSKKCVD